MLVCDASHRAAQARTRPNAGRTRAAAGANHDPLPSVQDDRAEEHIPHHPELVVVSFPILFSLFCYLPFLAHFVFIYSFRKRALHYSYVEFFIYSHLLIFLSTRHEPLIDFALSVFHNNRPHYTHKTELILNCCYLVFSHQFRHTNNSVALSYSYCFWLFCCPSTSSFIFSSLLMLFILFLEILSAFISTA